MDTKAYLAIAARAGLKALALVLIGHGFLQSSGTEVFIAVGMVFLDHGYSIWKAYGSVMLKASLDILRARVLNAAARAQAAPGLAAPALASVAAHVEATTPTGSPTVAPVASVAILAIGLLGLLPPVAAYAQGNRGIPVARPFTPTVPTGNPITDLHNAIEGQKEAVTASRNADTEDLVGKLGKLALPDFEFALAMSNATNNVVSGPCWKAWVDLLTAQQKPLMGPGAPLLNTDGTPQLDANGKPLLGPPQTLTEPDPHLATSVEKISELLAALRPDSTLSTGCAALAGAAGKDAATLIQGILGGGALGLFKLPIPIGPIP